MATLRFTVNGTSCAVPADPTTPLLDVLRDELQLRGTRFGCGAGECGACHVLVDGVSLASCNLPLWAVQGKAVTTVEGLPPALAQAFVAEQAVQCGYCSSGVLVDRGRAAAARAEPHRKPRCAPRSTATCAAAARTTASCAPCCAPPPARDEARLQRRRLGAGAHRQGGARPGHPDRAGADRGRRAGRRGRTGAGAGGRHAAWAGRGRHVGQPVGAGCRRGAAPGLRAGACERRVHATGVGGRRHTGLRPVAAARGPAGQTGGPAELHPRSGAAGAAARPRAAPAAAGLATGRCRHRGRERRARADRRLARWPTAGRAVRPQRVGRAGDRPGRGHGALALHVAVERRTRRARSPARNWRRPRASWANAARAPARASPAR